MYVWDTCGTESQRFGVSKAGPIPSHYLPSSRVLKEGRLNTAAGSQPDAMGTTLGWVVGPGKPEMGELQAEEHPA